MPLVIFHSISLWNDTYSWLFWSTYLVIAFVFWKEYWSGEPIAVWRFRFGWTCLVVSCLAGILANSIGSSYLGQVAAIGALSAFLFVAGGSLHFVRVLVLVGLLGLLVIPDGLWQPLAKFTNDRFVDGTSGALDYLAIPNVRTDWKIEFPKVAVDVGVLGWATESLFSVMLATACFLTYRRRSVFDFAIRMIALPWIAFALFVLKILLVYWASAIWNRNLTLGTSGSTFQVIYGIWYFVATWWMMIGLSWCFSEIPPPSSKDSPLLGAELFNRFILWPFRPSYRKRIVRIKRTATPGTAVEGAIEASAKEPSANDPIEPLNEDVDDFVLKDVPQSMRWLGWIGMGIWLAFSLIAVVSYLSHPELRSVKTRLSSRQLEKIEGNQDIGIQPTEGKSVRFAKPDIESPTSLGWKTMAWTLVDGSDEITISFHYPLDRAESAFSRMESRGWDIVEVEEFEAGEQPTAVESMAREGLLTKAEQRVYVAYVLLDRRGEPVSAQDDQSGKSIGSLLKLIQDGPIASIFRKPTKSSAPYFLLRITQANATKMDGTQPEICRSLLKTLVPLFTERIQGALGND